MFDLQIVFWFWWILAIGFLAVEVMVTSFFFLWLAVAAFLVGIILLLATSLTAHIQLLLFSVIALTSLLAWRKYSRHRKPSVSDHPLLNQRGAQYTGRTFHLQEAIVNGRGKIEVDGTFWTVVGLDCPEGTQIKITGVKGTTLLVDICNKKPATTQDFK